MNRFVPALLLLAAAGPACADDFGAGAWSFEANYGVAYGAEEQAFEPGTRDANGNRTVIDGRILEGSTLSGGLGDDTTTFGQWIGASSAVGNQLNVITNGDFNTVIVDSTQINSGDQTAIVGGN